MARCRVILWSVWQELPEAADVSIHRESRAFGRIRLRLRLIVRVMGRSQPKPKRYDKLLRHACCAAVIVCAVQRASPQVGVILS